MIRLPRPLPNPLLALRARLDTFRQFVATDTGAVTVDWVVLTAAVVGLGLASVAAVRTGTGNLGDDIETSLSGASVATLGDLSGGGAQSGLAQYQTRYDWGYDIMEWMVANSADHTDEVIVSSYNHWMSSLQQGYTPEALDAAYVLVTEMQARGIATPEQIATVNELIAANPA